MNKQRTFITDLDHTIIHSKYPDYICVERHADQRPITYMTAKSCQLLQQLLTTPTIETIPCTMRNLFQLQRIDWVQQFPPKFAICSNGAQIYIDGQLDEKWEALMRARTTAKQVEADCQKVAQLQLTQAEIQNIEQFYLVVKCVDVAYAKNSFAFVQKIFQTNRQVFRSGRKIFVITPEIDKQYAIEYLQTCYDLPNIMTSGDSEADRKFTTIGQAILPKHATFTHQYAVVTTTQGIQATEEILTYVLNFESTGEEYLADEFKTKYERHVSETV
ncbi:MAG: HAD family hydrolase [Culicoidibacterales bacterium]